jgi:hypothetical protein
MTLVRVLAVVAVTLGLGLGLRQLGVHWPWDALVIVPFAVAAGRFVIPRES